MEHLDNLLARIKCSFALIQSLTCLLSPFIYSETQKTFVRDRETSCGTSFQGLSDANEDPWKNGLSRILEWKSKAKGSWKRLESSEMLHAQQNNVSQEKVVPIVLRPIVKINCRILGACTMEHQCYVPLLGHYCFLFDWGLPLVTFSTFRQFYLGNGS